MILYDSGDVVRVVFKYAGTIWPEVLKPFLLWCALSFMYYIFVEEVHPPKNADNATILGSSMTFLLVFRLQQAYSRYWQGRTCVSGFFGALRNLMMMTCLLTHGGAATMGWLSGQQHLMGTLPEDVWDERAREFRVNMVRYIIAYAAALKLHTRVAAAYCVGSVDKEEKWLIDWDRLRLRQLLAQEEFDIVDDSVRQLGDQEYMKANLEDLANLFRSRDERGPPSSWPDTFEVETDRRARSHFALCFYLRQEIIRSGTDNSNAQPWGIKERYCAKLTALVSEAQHNWDVINQIITTPIALPYASLCKTLCAIWMISNPITLDHSLGFIGSYVVSAMIAVALLGIDCISTELENPFGDDDNDLDILEHIHSLETEALEFLDLCGDAKGRQCFVWRRMPRFVADSSVKPLSRHLAFGKHAAEEVVTSDRGTASSSYRSSDRLISESSGGRSSLSSR